MKNTIVLLLIAAIACMGLVLGCETESDNSKPTWTVSFDTDEGTPETIKSIKVERGKTLGSKFPTDPTKQGLTFGGWFDDFEGEGTQYTATTRITKNVILIAWWRTGTFYTVTFALDGGDGTFPPIPNIQANTSLGDKFPSAEPTKGGFLFVGWWDDSATPPARYLANTTIRGNITLTAHWLPPAGTVVGTVKYIRNLNAEDNTEIATAKTVTSPATTVETLPGDPTYTTEPGYTFTGWNTASAGGNATVFRATTDISSLVDANKVVNVYAQWDYKAPLEPWQQVTVPDAPANYVNLGTTGTFTVTVGEANEYTGVSGQVQIFDLGAGDTFGAGYWVTITLIPATADSPRPIGVWVTPDNNDNPFDWSLMDDGAAFFQEIVTIDAPEGKYCDGSFVVYYDGLAGPSARYRRMDVGIKFPDDTEPGTDYDFIISAVKAPGAPPPNFKYTTQYAPPTKTLILADNFQYGTGYQERIDGPSLFNATDTTIKEGDVYEIEMEFTVSRDLEDMLEMCIVDPTINYWKERTRFLQVGNPTEICQTGKTYTYSSRLTFMEDAGQMSNTHLYFQTSGEGVQGTGGSGVKKPVTLTFSKLNWSKISTETAGIARVGTVRVGVSDGLFGPGPGVRATLGTPAATLAAVVCGAVTVPFGGLTGSVAFEVHPSYPGTTVTYKVVTGTTAPADDSGMIAIADIPSINDGDTIWIKSVSEDGTQTLYYAVTVTEDEEPPPAGE
jgi:uncharacterized repeat protein (TIGR02543 family)